MSSLGARLQKAAIERIVYPLMERLRGNRVRQRTRELQALEAGGGEAYRREKLAALLRWCAERVPAYEALDPSAGDPCDCLAGVPVLDKQTFRAHSGRYLAGGVPESRRIPNQSGGSTGVPIHFFMDRTQAEFYEAARWRGLSWYGITPGSRSVMVWGSPVELDRSDRRRYLRRERLLKNRRILSAYHLSEADAAAYLALLNRYRPEYLYGYATALAALAEILRPRRAALRVRLKAVVSTAETLLPWQRELLADVFSCPVVNEYGARDAGILAYSCPCGSLHLTVENAVVEILDPISLQPVPPGHPGLLAVTDLNGTVQPRLRYLLGDVAALDAAPCPCGRAMPVLRALEGREDALLVGENGALVHGNFINQLLRRHAEVRQFQLVQHSPGTATLYLVMEPDEALRSQMAAELRRVIPGLDIETQYVAEIPPAPSGKVRYCVREFSLT